MFKLTLIQIKPIVFTISLLSLIGLAGCPQRETVVNTIHKDGSITRTVTLTSDNDSIQVSNLSVPVDSFNWKLERTALDTMEFEHDYRYTFTRHYENPELMNDDYKNKKSIFQQLDRNIQVTKRFLWFFNTITYRETYSSIFIPQDYHHYLSDEEYEIFTYPDPKEHPSIVAMDSIMQKYTLDDIEDKFNRLLTRGIFETYLYHFKECMVDIDPNYDLSINDVTLDSLLTEEIDFELFEDDFYKYLPTFVESIDPDSDSMTLEEANRCVLEGEGGMIMSRFETAFLDSYENCVCMEGRLLETNAEEISSDTLCWDVEGEKYFVDDFVMTAKSKHGNTWAYWVTALLIVGAITLYFYKPTSN